ncbi:MAG TPA: TIGR02453 family protein [Ignavibacteriales bacterium]|nr:TIGR02453 family protein [Ignavibacteriales bacterium]
MKSNFPQCTAEFLSKLSRNNSREWFESHREDYKAMFLEPAQEFIIEMGSKLQTIRPNIVAIPKVDKSIFRLHRDVRFSKDKLPYKTNLGILFWEGDDKKLESSGFYFHIEPNYFFIGGGTYIFSDNTIKAYREALSDKTAGEQIASAINKMKKAGYQIGGQHFKRLPKGFDEDFPHADLLLHNGLYSYLESKEMNQLKPKTVVDFCFKHFKSMLAVHSWLADVLPLFR